MPFFGAMPAPIFEFFQGPAPLPPLFIIFLALNPAARPAGAGSGQRERGPGRGGVDHYLVATAAV